jgi:hypothetical protein
MTKIIQEKAFLKKIHKILLHLGASLKHHRLRESPRKGRLRMGRKPVTIQSRSRTCLGYPIPLLSDQQLERSLDTARVFATALLLTATYFRTSPIDDSGLLRWWMFPTYCASSLRLLEISRLSRSLQQQGEYVLLMKDDGRGSDFVGRHSLSELDAARMRPGIIKDRLRTIFRDLVIESAPNRGARLKITFQRDYA